MSRQLVDSPSSDGLGGNFLNKASSPWRPWQEAVRDEDKRVPPAYAARAGLLPPTPRAVDKRVAEAWQISTRGHEEQRAFGQEGYQDAVSSEVREVDGYESFRSERTGLPETASRNFEADGLLPRVLSFLDERKIKYQVTRFSPSHDQAEIERELARLGMGLLQGIPAEVPGKGLILAVIPAARRLCPDDLSKLFAQTQVRLLSPGEISRRLSFVHSTDVVPPLGDLFGLQCLLSPLVEQNHTVGFFADAGNTLITLEASEFRRAGSADASAMPIPTRSKYRAYATPGRKAFKRCILGVSLEGPEFYSAKLVAITDWIRQHHGDCDVMMGDGMYRITLQLNSSALEDEALERSKWLARDFVYSNLSVFNPRESSYRFNFVFCSEIQKTAGYRGYYDELCNLFRTNEGFQKSVDDFASYYLSRSPVREHSDAAAELSRTYLLEELAVICCLAEDSPCTFVHPKSLTILAEIAEGKHPYLPPALQQIDYVELKLKRR
jgi:tRNA-dependent cyclodipeptide synthase